MNVRQVFENHTGEVQEGTWRFRLSPSGAVGDFAVWDGLVRIPGVIVEKKRARAIYEELTTQRIDPGLLQQGEEDDPSGGGADRPSGGAVFSVKVAPIPAWGTKRLEMQYQEEVPWADGVGELRIPLRPGEGEPTSAGSLEVTVTLEDGTFLDAPASALPLAVSGKTARFSGSDVPLAKDVVVRVRPASSAPLAFAAFRSPDGKLPDGLALAPWERLSDVPPEKDGFFLLEHRPAAVGGLAGLGAGRRRAELRLSLRDPLRHVPVDPLGKPRDRVGLPRTASSRASDPRTVSSSFPSTARRRPTPRASPPRPTLRRTRRSRTCGRASSVPGRRRPPRSGPPPRSSRTTRRPGSSSSPTGPGRRATSPGPPRGAPSSRSSRATSAGRRSRSPRASSCRCRPGARPSRPPASRSSSHSSSPTSRGRKPGGAASGGASVQGEGGRPRRPRRLRRPDAASARRLPLRVGRPLRAPGEGDDRDGEAPRSPPRSRTARSRPATCRAAGRAPASTTSSAGSSSRGRSASGSRRSSSSRAGTSSSRPTPRSSRRPARSFDRGASSRATRSSGSRPFRVRPPSPRSSRSGGSST